MAQGSSKTLQNFHHDIKDGQKHENTIYLFFENNFYAQMRIYFGLVSDGKYNTS